MIEWKEQEHIVIGTENMICYVLSGILRHEKILWVKRVSRVMSCVGRWQNLPITHNNYSGK